MSHYIRSKYEMKLNKVRNGYERNEFKDYIVWKKIKKRLKGGKKKGKKKMKRDVFQLKK